MASVASQLIEEVTAHAKSDSLVDAREICADGTYFPNNLRSYISETLFSFLSPCNIVNFKIIGNQLVAHNVFHLVKSHIKTH